MRTLWCDCNVRQKEGYSYVPDLDLWVRSCCSRPSRAFVNSDGTYKRQSDVRPSKLDFNIEHYIIHSNAIEGVTQRKQIPKSLDAWFFLRQQPFISEPMVLRAHKLIMQDFLQRFGYRQTGVMVVDRSTNPPTEHLCPHHLQVPELMEQWLADLRTSDDPKDMHIRFEKIHPFVDGNGRVGRMLMWDHELRLGRIPTQILFSEREKYYEWFRD